MHLFLVLFDFYWQWNKKPNKNIRFHHFILSFCTFSSNTTVGLRPVLCDGIKTSVIFLGFENGWLKFGWIEMFRARIHNRIFYCIFTHWKRIQFGVNWDEFLHKHHLIFWLKITFIVTHHKNIENIVLFILLFILFLHNLLMQIYFYSLKMSLFFTFELYLIHLNYNFQMLQIEIVK